MPPTLLTVPWCCAWYVMFSDDISHMIATCSMKLMLREDKSGVQAALQARTHTEALLLC